MAPEPSNGGTGDDRFSELRRTGDRELRDELVRDHLGLAHHIARKFSQRGEPYDDLLQVASLGLVKAVDRFDPEREVKFSTFAVAYIVGELKRYFRDRGWAVRAPRRIQELYLEMGTATEELTHSLGRSPTVSEIGGAVGASNEAILEALEAGRGYRASSLETPDRAVSLSDAIPNDEDPFARVEDNMFPSSALQHLSSRDREIIRLRFGEELTQSEIAARMGVSQMHVSRLLAASLRHLRTAIATEGNRGPG
jgi:RNA polymerase sigma-B factor